MKYFVVWAILLAGASVSLAGDWPQWRGPYFNGSTDETGLPSEWSTTENIAWSVEMPGASAATPIIWKGRVFVSSTDSENESLVAMCLDRRDGKVLWRHTAGEGSRKDRRSNFAAPSPVTDGEVVVFFYGTGDLVGFDLEGNRLWARNIQDDYGEFAFLWTFSSSPTLIDGRLYLQVLQRDEPIQGRGGEGAESYLLAIDAGTGKTIWRHIRPSKAVRESREAFSTPIPFSVGGVTRLLVVGGDVLSCHDLDSGEELWRWGQWNPNRIPHWRVVPSPVIGEGLILVCPPKNVPVYAIAPPSGAGSGPPTGTGSGKAATVEWVSTEAKELTSDVPTPAFYDGDFFILSDLRDYLSRAEAGTGEVKWSIETPGSAKYEASPLAGDGKVYLINHDGEVVVVDADDGRIISMIAMDKPTDENLVRASISAAYGQLFIRTTSRLYCVGEGVGKGVGEGGGEGGGKSAGGSDVEGDGIRKKAEGFFDLRDANNDGMLSRGEFGKAFFDEVDSDGDGMVSLEEDIAYRTGRLSRQLNGRRTADRRRLAPERQASVADGAKIERDIVYTTVGEREMLLDLYLPLDAEEPLPVIAWIHGGGWKGGSKGSGGKARAMLERGYAVVDVGYRLSGEAIFPAQVQDCKAAIRWIRANAAKYGLDGDRIGVWGGSAGGHLVAFLGTSGDAAQFETKTNAKYSSGVQAVCDWYGPTDFLQMDAHSIEGGRLVHDSPDSPESRLVGGPIQQEPYSSLARKANPITYVTKDDPPFLIMHGDMDMSVPVHQSELLYDALKKAGVTAELYVVKGAGHGLKGAEESSEELFEMAAGFFDKYLD